MKKIKFLIGGTLLILLIALNIGKFENKITKDSSLKTIISSAHAQDETNINITEPNKTRRLVVTTTKISATVELCGDVAASYLGLVSGSITGCITVNVERTIESHDCPDSGYTC